MMKQVNEEVARQYARKHGLQVVILRPAAIFGAGNTMSPETIVSLPAIGQPGRGRFPAARHQNAVAVEDLAELFAQVALAPRLRYDCYLAAGHTFAWGQVKNLVQRFIADADITFDESVTKVEGGFAYRYDSRRAATEFDWHLHSLEDAVQMNINSAREAAGLPGV